MMIKKRKKTRKNRKADINHILHYNMGVCLHRLTTFHSIAVVIRPGRKDPAFSFIYLPEILNPLEVKFSINWRSLQFITIEMDY